MINEYDIRLLNERRKDYERAARNYRQARDIREARAKANRKSRSAFARIAALFL